MAGFEVTIEVNTIESDTNIVPLLAANSTLIQQIRANVDKWGVAFNIVRTDKRGDELTLTFPNEWDNKDAIPLLVSVRNHFRLFEGSRSKGSSPLLAIDEALSKEVRIIQEALRQQKADLITI